MPIFPEAPIRLHVTGRAGDRPLAGVASLAVNAEGILLAPLDSVLQAADVVRIPFDAIDGALADESADGTLSVFLADGERITGRGDARVRGLADAILYRGRTVPELTRAVRALGRGQQGDEQEAFFKPLLDAKRHAVRDWTAALDAFDPASLRAALETTLAAIAAAREPTRPAARRALEACLCDAADPLVSAFAPVGRAAAAARDAGPRDALLEWRRWVRSVHLLFERADAAWLEVHEVLAASRADVRRQPSVNVNDRLRRPWTS